jgi:hypothetical protein
MMYIYKWTYDLYLISFYLHFASILNCTEYIKIQIENLCLIFYYKLKI